MTIVEGAMFCVAPPSGGAPGAGAQGRGRGAYLSCAASFLALSAVLLYAQHGAFYMMRPGFLGFLFCGLLWGLSLIVPGMTSFSILMAVGLFTPMAEGFARLDMAVILPWLLGMALIVLTLARVVIWCFQTHSPLFYHAVFGIVLASKGYPGDYEKGHEIKGLDRVEGAVYHMGTRADGGRILTNGGRVLFVVGKGRDLAEARRNALADVARIDCDNLFHRTDIGHRAFDDLER